MGSRTEEEAGSAEEEAGTAAAPTATAVAAEVEEEEIEGSSI